MENETKADKDGVLTDLQIYALAKAHEGEHGTDMLGFARAVLAAAGVALPLEGHDG